MKNNFKRYSNNQDENINKTDINNNVNTSYHLKNSKFNEKVNKSNFENSNLKDRSYSPITHKRNQYVDDYVNVKISNTDFKEEKKNISYFEDFNVRKYFNFNIHFKKICSKNKFNKFFD